MKYFFSQAAILLTLHCYLSSCGVKGPPLPPLAETPQKMDNQDEAAQKPTTNQLKENKKEKKKTQ